MLYNLLVIIASCTNLCLVATHAKSVKLGCIFTVFLMFLWFFLFQDDLSAAVSKAKSDSESAHRALLLRLFPDVKVKEEAGSDLEKWLQNFAKASQESVR